jgi:chromate reductase
MVKIAVFVGSLRENSSNRNLAKALEMLKPESMQFEYVDIRVPLYNEDIENAGIPEEVQKIKKIVEATDGVLFATPEYNRSIPGVLKNVIDWVSRPYGASSFKDKPVGIVGSSMSPVGTALAQSDLRNIMLFQGSKVLGQPEVYIANAYEVFDDNGVVISDRWIKNLKQYVETFADWIENK